MRTELTTIYVPSCEQCQRNKSLSHKPSGPLHPLPVPDAHGDSVAIDFVGPLPEDDSYNYILSMTDRLGSDLRLVPCCTDLTATKLAELFFREWYCENDLPLEIIFDHDKLFVSQFWHTLHRLTGVKLKMSTAFHPQTDSSSERSNRTIIQALRYHVARNQKDDDPSITWLAADIACQIDIDVMEAQDNLLLAKTQQAFHADKHRGPEVIYKAWLDSSVYTLDLPESSHIFPTFHGSLLRPFIPNDDTLFPHRAHEQPGPIVGPRGQEEFFVERILDRRRRGRRWQYLVRWRGYGPEHDQWLPRAEVEDLAALDAFFTEHGIPDPAPHDTP
ncbi:hypothetical protein NM688_g6704 [Phlebia brevispora]|uniref:Uncharacterized protein n=1 Tax=Phlebia brevispora TaxID=194682 RepID=A0ACC1SDF0_9APHY|nr:hypothetical protein NM688_g6704 [Phlebia brevispora]